MTHFIAYRNMHPGQRALGTAADDNMIGDGTGGAVYWGGAGDDEINPGINISRDPADVVKIYGGVSRFGSHPGNPVVGELGVTDLRDDGDDILHGGANVNASGGGGRNTYVNHGPSDPTLPFRVFGFDIDTDTLVFHRNDGFTATKAGGRTFTDDGQKYLELQSVMIVSRGDPDDFVQQQATFVTFTDDGRMPDAWEPPVIRWTGESYRDDVDRWVHAHADGGADDFIL